MNRIQIDSVYTNQNSDRPSAINTSKIVSKVSKPKPKKKINLSNILSADEIQKDLEEEITEAEILLDDINKILPPPKFEGGEISVDELRNMEEAIRRKSQMIKNIEEEIKMIKNGTYFDTKKNVQVNLKLGADIKAKREAIMKVKSLYLEKLSASAKKKEGLRVMEDNFRKKCEKEGIEYLTFEQFKDLEAKKKRQQKRVEKMKKTQKKQMSSIKQFTSISKNQDNFNGNTESKKMKDLLQKKNVAETALKTAKKRHALQVNDLMGKLEFLRDENADLEDKLSIKLKELMEAESKFSQSRTMTDRNLLIRHFKADNKF